MEILFVNRSAKEIMSEEHNNQATEIEGVEDDPEVIVEAELVEEPAVEIETVSVEEYEALLQELEEWRAKSEEYLDGWQRARAEFANYKKRVERDRAQAYQIAAANIFKNYLDVLDDLERALRERPEGDEAAIWASGIQLIYRKLLSILEAEGVTVMEAENQYFDPNIHEAISSEDNADYESGQIIEVLKQGYVVGDKVLRPALVRVAR
jgi:molecular chaperone GrpE